jgi:carbon starvation protein
MALIAACVLTPGVYLAINSGPAVLGGTAESAAAAIAQWGFVVTPAELNALAAQIGESSVISRTGGAPSLAVGMAHIFSNALSGGGAMALWYHFAIMFEALFILTVVDAGTRVGRFMLQDMGKHIWEPFGRTSWYPAVYLASAIFVGMWGWFLIGGVTDPLGGIYTLWPLFGISNQLLACVALCVATTIIVKMGKARYMWVTLLPLLWVGTVTLTAGWQKVFAAAPLGFLATARGIAATVEGGGLPAGATSVGDAQRMIFNNNLDAAVAIFFMACVVVIITASAREWIAVISGRKPAVSTEVPFTPRVQAAYGGDD